MRNKHKISSPICDYLCSVIVCIPLQISGAVKQESSNIGMVLAQECAMAVAAVTGAYIWFKLVQVWLLYTHHY